MGEIIYWKEFEKRPPLEIVPDEERFGGRHVCDDERVESCGLGGVADINNENSISWFRLFMKNGEIYTVIIDEKTDTKKAISQAEEYLKSLPK